MVTKTDKQLGFEGEKSTTTGKAIGHDDKTVRTGRSELLCSGGGILVGQNIRISSDSLNIIISRRQVNRKTGSSRWRADNYFATLEAALHELVNQGVRDSQLKDVRCVVVKIEELKRDISGALKGMTV